MPIDKCKWLIILSAISFAASNIIWPNFTTCGIREDDLLLDCWLVNASKPDFDPPLELSSPGLCRASECGVDEFAFNVSVLNELALTSVCVREDLRICSPCGSNCSKGFFLSSECSRNADRVCTACSLCQNSSCFGVCYLINFCCVKSLIKNNFIFYFWHFLLTPNKLINFVFISDNFFSFIISWD